MFFLIQNLKLRKEHCKKLRNFCYRYLIVTSSTSLVYEIRGILKITVFWDVTLCMDVSEGYTHHDAPLHPRRQQTCTLLSTVFMLKLFRTLLLDVSVSYFMMDTRV